MVALEKAQCEPNMRFCLYPTKPDGAAQSLIHIHSTGKMIFKYFINHFQVFALKIAHMKKWCCVLWGLIRIFILLTLQFVLSYWACAQIKSHKLFMSVVQIILCCLLTANLSTSNDLVICLSAEGRWSFCCLIFPLKAPEVCECFSNVLILWCTFSLVSKRTVSNNLK